MKSELRNELKSNLLADRLEEIVLAIKPHLKLIGFSLAAMVVAVIVYGVVHARNEKASASAWSELYFSANQAEKLDDVYQDFPSTSAGLWAKQKTADLLLSLALNQVYFDRDLADKLLLEARQAYRSVLAKAQEPMLVCRATYGLAQVFDSEGNSSEAAREFKKILTLSGSHADMIADAQRRLEFIESDKGRAFYEWFKNNRPTAPRPVDIPSNLGTLPSQPDLQFSAPPTTTDPVKTNELAPTSEPSVSTPASVLEMPPPNKTSSTVPAESNLESAPVAKPPVLEPPIAEPTIEEPKDKPKVEEPKVEEPKKSKKAKKKKEPAPKADEQESKIPDAEPSAPAKQAGGT